MTDPIRKQVRPDAIATAYPLRWGFRNEVRRLALPDGREVVVTRFADHDAAPEIVTLTRLAHLRLSANGVPTPRPVDDIDVSPGVLVTEYVAGAVGAELLDDDAGAARLGSICGGIWRRFADLDTTGLPLDRRWTHPPELVRASLARLERYVSETDGPSHAVTVEELTSLPELLVSRPPSFVHGDFAPVNVIVRDGELVAIVDFEFARVADGLLDAGWFHLIVAYHHPERAEAAWDTFLAASGIVLDDGVTRRLIHLLPIVRLLEILDDSTIDAGAGRRWAGLLDFALVRP